MEWILDLLMWKKKKNLHSSSVRGKKKLKTCKTLLLCSINPEMLVNAPSSETHPAFCPVKTDFCVTFSTIEQLWQRSDWFSKLSCSGDTTLPGLTARGSVFRQVSPAGAKNLRSKLRRTGQNFPRLLLKAIWKMQNTLTSLMSLNWQRRCQLDKSWASLKKTVFTGGYGLCGQKNLYGAHRWSTKI